MLNSLNFFGVLVFKGLHPKSKAVELERIVDVFDRSHKWEEEHHVLELLFRLKFDLAVTFASAEVEEKGHKMDYERIPHQEEGHRGPQVMATVVQVVRGERVSKDVRQRQDRIEEEKETYLYVVLQRPSS